MVAKLLTHAQKSVELDRRTRGEGAILEKIRLEFRQLIYIKISDFKKIMYFQEIIIT